MLDSLSFVLTGFKRVHIQVLAVIWNTVRFRAVHVGALSRGLRWFRHWAAATFVFHPSTFSLKRADVFFSPCCLSEVEAQGA